ncbi:MAG: hypothetical protein KGL38_03490 [Gemmatimonadota bacterium]|nr:hypothetical protein [Gemmatimonadota bacterium]MDE3127041.1 hypothetical protein [Gemmatimonadota bacterium]MDE3172576.1 hypothetical protein [Gemmatimonadota bacterium]MDE3215689.1 hypothetical protein [Gemmatimonadota bacterium]
MNSQGPLATLYVGIALCAFYCALVWINTLLPLFLQPLFIIPVTWLLEISQGKRPGAAGEG